MCIVKNKIYKITAIWFAPTLATIGLHNKFTGAPTDVFDELKSLVNGSHFPLKKATVGAPVKFRFILYCEEDKTKIERIYPVDFQLELDANSYVEMEN